MKYRVLFAFLFWCCSGIAIAQQQHPAIGEQRPGACSGEHKPTDQLACYATFDGNPAFSDVQVLFQLQGQIAPDQRGMASGFWLRSNQEFEKGTYKLVGTIPNCASGTYRLIRVDANIASKGGRNYFYGTDFHDDITVIVKDSDANLFPPLKDVSAEPPKEEAAKK